VDPQVTPDGDEAVLAYAHGTTRVWPLDWRTALWRATTYCLPVEQRVTKLGEAPEQAEAGLALCRRTGERCRRASASVAQCRKAVEEAYGPFEFVL
jgi:hypothetical protein